MMNKEFIFFDILPTECKITQRIIRDYASEIKTTSMEATQSHQNLEFRILFLSFFSFLAPTRGLVPNNDTFSF